MAADQPVPHMQATRVQDLRDQRSGAAMKARTNDNGIYIVMAGSFSGS